MAASVPTKVFVGNLSFKTRDADLARAFEVVGKVTSANIITRGPRSLGYGFVELSSEEEANKAIAQLNKSDLDGRQINVEIARPREQTGQDGASPDSNNNDPAQRPRRRRQPRPAAAGSVAPAAGGDAAATRSPSDKPRRARKPRVPGAPAAGGAAPAAAGSVSAAPAAAGDDGRRPARRGRSRRFGRFQRFRRPQRTDEQPRIPSATTLFVANLHYQVDNEGLAGIFNEFNPTKAYVVQTHSGRSRGFGFVEFGTETDQQNALKSIDKKVVNERPLSVKVSQVRPPQPAAASSEAPKN